MNLQISLPLWRFLIGFNISHAMAALLFGLIYGFLAITHGGLPFFPRRTCLQWAC
jgi:hypothetical protein